MVKAWKEQVVIPTYEVGSPEKAPMFLEKRVYQGSSGVVYPYPVIEHISDEKTDKEYQAVFIENEYIKVMILPELGGRVQMAYDKIAGRHFVYYNRVIKPALVGLAGPWISGGIEFNWPQHHRPSTYLPVDCTIEEFPDGSVTVWVSEMEQMFHQKGMAGFMLRPGCARLEIQAKLYNRTDVPQTFLWWANPAVAVNDHYQSVFPPDINAVFDHGKRDVSSFPIATGTYYKMDYSAGVDISNYKNIKVPTSYMAVNSRFDFEGGYENDTQAGMLHVASHYISPGKKQWTWGNGDFGRAWDRNLTDEDGPYIELMAGVYTENQPDFAWLQPYEEKRFTQYFFPYRELGIVKNATKDLVMNIEEAGDGQVCFKVFATRQIKATITLRAKNGETLYQQEQDISPEKIVRETVTTNGADLSELLFSISDGSRVLLDWQAEPDEVKPIPDAACAALRPEEIKSTEQLYLTGLHLEQYRHATFNPVEYYEEALRRDPDDTRCNNALGLWYLRHGRFDKAEQYLLHAIRILQRLNANPYDGEAIYNLGLVLKYQGRYGEAYARFAKACWNAAWQDAGYFNCAQIALMQGNPEQALEDVNNALVRNSAHHKARALKAEVLRLLHREAEALQLIEDSLSLDRFNYGAIWVKYLIQGNELVLNQLTGLLHDHPHNYDEIALDFVAMGRYAEAIALWQQAIAHNAVTPMTYYYIAHAMHMGNISNPKQVLERAIQMPLDYCFPNRLEAILALEYAQKAMPNNGTAYYLLGILYYDKRQYDKAIALWEEAAERIPNYPMVWRNLALARFNKQGDPQSALTYMERAFTLNTGDARMLMELDQLHKRLHAPHEERLARLEHYSDLVEQRDDLILEHATLLNRLGRYEHAKTLIDSRRFHPWEGGEGKVTMQYQFCRTELAKQALQRGDHSLAATLLVECLTYPPHLGEGKLHGAQENDFYYLLGLAYEGMGDTAQAHTCWEHAAEGNAEPAPALYYNDAKPDKIFYQGMALQRLGCTNEARSCFHRLLTFGEKHLFDQIKMDYFAVSLPDLLIWDDDLNVRNKVHCNYMMALGHYGLGNIKKAERYLSVAQQIDHDHCGMLAFAHLMNLETKQDK